MNDRDPVARSIANAPFDPEVLSEEEERALDRAEVWFEANGGDGIPHEEILSEFGLTVEDFNR